MLGMALIAVDVTLVGTAMPTIVGSLGGVALYSWVVAGFLLTSTTTVPSYGRLSDLYGRKPVFLFGISVFLIGSALSGTASSIEQLVAYRAVQGLGAGAIQPMTMTIMGDAFGIERRVRMQAFTSAVWGASSFLGPALGALIVTYGWWNLVFFVNIPVGLFALTMILTNYHETVEHRERSVDWLGGLLLTAGATALLVAFQRSGGTGGLGELSGFRRTQRFYIFCVFAPALCSSAAIGVLFAWLYQPRFGPINAALALLGLPRQGFLTVADQALYAVVAVDVWQHVGFGAIVFLAGLLSIPESVIDAARIDGANRWALFWRVTLPLLSHTTLFMAVITLIGSFQVFDLILVMTGGGPGSATYVLSYLIYNEGLLRNNMGAATAISLVMFAIILVFTIAQFRLLRPRWEY